MSQTASHFAVCGSNMDSEKIRHSVKGVSSCAFPYGTDESEGHCYSQLDAQTFCVRGENYLTDQVKNPSVSSLFDLMHVDIFKCESKLGHLAARDDSWLRRAREAGDDRFYLVITYITPVSPFVHLILYYAVQPDRVKKLPHVENLWQQFCEVSTKGEAFRNERWKVIPRIADGPWMVRKSVGTKPALLATKLTHTWIFSKGPNSDIPVTPPIPADQRDENTPTYVTDKGPGPYLEVDCDVASSKMAYVLVSMLQNSAKYLVIDLGFAVEPREKDTLPEAVLGSIRLSRIDLQCVPSVELSENDEVLGSPGVKYSQLNDISDNH